MVRSLLLIGLMTTLTVFSCGKDEPTCASTALADVIVGSFEVNTLGISSGTVEFRADGTLIDPDDALVGSEINGMVLDQKSYTTVGDSLLNIHLETSTGTASQDFSFDVTDIECNEIRFDIIGFTARLIRQ